MKTKISKFLILSFAFLSFLLANNIKSITSSKKLSLISLIGGAALTYAGWDMCYIKSCWYRDGEKKCKRIRFDFAHGGKFGQALLLGGISAMLFGGYSLAK